MSVKLEATRYVDAHQRRFILTYYVDNLYHACAPYNNMGCGQVFSNSERSEVSIPGLMEFCIASLQASKSSFLHVCYSEPSSIAGSKDVKQSELLSRRKTAATSLRTP